MKVTISGYLDSRQYNRKLFAKLKNAIEELQYDATAELEMSAKYQTPMVIVRGRDRMFAEEEIEHLLSEYFHGVDAEDREDSIVIHFRDRW